MEDIRKLSGASIGSIYHHFANKELLARALYLEGRTSLNATLRAASTCSPMGIPCAKASRRWLMRIWGGSKRIPISGNI